MMRTLAYCLAVAGLATAQIVVDNTNQPDTVEPDRVTDDTPNYSDFSGSTTIPPITAPLPTITSICNHLGCSQTNTYANISSTGEATCVTIYKSGEPVFSIQTNTVLPTACTRTVYGSVPMSSGGSTANMTGSLPVPINSTMTTKPSGSVTGGGQTTTVQNSNGQPTSGRPTLTQTAVVGGGGQEGTSTGAAGQTGSTSTTNPSMQSGSPADRLHVVQGGIGLVAAAGVVLLW